MNAQLGIQKYLGYIFLGGQFNWRKNKVPGENQEIPQVTDKLFQK
jgi:hypothetical protein